MKSPSPFMDNELVLKAGRAAAHTAEHGTREEQSGRFLPPPGWTGTRVGVEPLKPRAKGPRRAA